MGIWRSSFSRPIANISKIAQNLLVIASSCREKRQHLLCMGLIFRRHGLLGPYMHAYNYTAFELTAWSSFYRVTAIIEKKIQARQANLLLEYALGLPSLSMIYLSLFHRFEKCEATGSRLIVLHIVSAKLICFNLPPGTTSARRLNDVIAVTDFNSWHSHACITNYDRVKMLSSFVCMPSRLLFKQKNKRKSMDDNRT